MGGTGEPAFERWAELSGDGRYRYFLGRRWQTFTSRRRPKPITFVMLNPSVADAAVDDPTVRKCIGFGQRLGFTELWVVNLFAWRATDPLELDDIADPVGDQNNSYLRDVFAATALHNGAVVAGWGRGGVTKEWRRRRVRQVLDLARWLAPDLHVLRLSQDKHGDVPHHPLMLPYSLCLKKWNPWKSQP